MDFGPLVNIGDFGGLGEPVYITHEWMPGDEVVQGSGAPGAPMYTPVGEASSGVKRVYVVPGTLPTTGPSPAEIAHAVARSRTAAEEETSARQIASDSLTLLLLLT